jgi:hypothetical protein
VNHRRRDGVPVDSRPFPFHLQHKRKYDLFADVNFISNTTHKVRSQLRALHLQLPHLHNLSFAFKSSSLSSSTETLPVISPACEQSANKQRTIHLPSSPARPFAAMASSLLDTLFGLCAGSFATLRIERMRTFKHFKSLPSSPDQRGSVNTATETWAGEVGGTIIGEIQGWQSIRKPWEVPNFGIIFRHRLSSESSSLRDPSSQHSSCDRFSNSIRSQPQCPSSSSTINHGHIERLRAFNQRFRRSLPSQLSAYLASPNSVEQKRDIKDSFTTSSGPIKVDERERRLSEEQLAACPRPDMLKIWPTRSPVELAKKLAQKEALPEEQRRQNELRAARFGRRGVKAGRGRQAQTGFRPREPTRQREFVPSGPIREARREIERRFAAGKCKFFECVGEVGTIRYGC